MIKKNPMSLSKRGKNAYYFSVLDLNDKVSIYEVKNKEEIRVTQEARNQEEVRKKQKRIPA